MARGPSRRLGHTRGEPLPAPPRLSRLPQKPTTAATVFPPGPSPNLHLGRGGGGTAPLPFHCASPPRATGLCLIGESGHFRRRPRPRTEALQAQGLPDCCGACPVVRLAGPRMLLLHSSPNPEDMSGTRGCLLLDALLLTGIWPAEV